MTKQITLHMNSQTDVTIVSNQFIDHYMSSANGEYVKIYLYLLRCINSGTPVSVSLIADKFDHTENDISRALKYWEKMNLLKLEYDDSSLLSGIQFMEFEAACEKVPRPAEQDFIQKEPPKPAESKAPLSIPEKPVYTPDQLTKMKNHSEVQQLLFVAEMYLGKTLSVSELQTIFYFYDCLHFSAELIEYLIEYCVSKEHKSIRYIEKVAVAWASDGIKTVAQAKETTDLFNKNTFAVLKAFGIKGRAPGESEKKYITKWSNEYLFSLDIITEACNRTIQAIHQPSFEYADSILKRWHEQNIKHLSDIRILDENHIKSKETANAAKPGSVSSNKFNNFQQNTYNYQELEKELLSN